MDSETKLTEVSNTGAVTSSENEEKNKKEKENQNTAEKDKTTSVSDSNMDKSGVREQSDNEDSEVDDYNLTEDQKRALEELDNLKTEMGYPDEDPPEYDVTERLKILNEDLKNDPTPVEKQKESKVGFKQNLVDLVAPPPDFSDDDGDKQNSPKNKNKTPQKQSEEKEDEKSETISSSSKQSNGTKKDEVLIEIDGQFQLVSADDVRAKDLGYVMDSDKNTENEKKEKENKENKENNKNKGKMQPSPPGKPRPATAQVNSRRNVRPTSSSSSGRQRPQSASATTTNHGSPLSNFDYYSPYALSPREKQLMEERKKALEKEKQEKDRRKKQEDQDKERENQEAFEYWLKKKRETDRRKRIQDEEDRKKNDKEDRRRIREFEANKEFSTYDILYYKDYSDSEEKAENEEAFKGWLKEKNSQFKKEKLLKRRQEQEMHDGYYIRSREDCEKAYKQWLKQKAIEARKARAAERQKAKLQRLAARRARKGISLSKSIQEAQSFRYVDYYGYRF